MPLAAASALTTRLLFTAAVILDPQNDNLRNKTGHIGNTLGLTQQRENSVKLRLGVFPVNNAVEWVAVRKALVK